MSKQMRLIRFTEDVFAHTPFLKMVLLLIVLWLKETADTLIEHMEQLKEAQLKVGDLTRSSLPIPWL